MSKSLSEDRSSESSGVHPRFQAPTSRGEPSPDTGPVSSAVPTYCGEGPCTSFPTNRGAAESLKFDSPSWNGTSPEHRCNHLNSNGKRCRMLRAPGESQFCSHHARQQLGEAQTRENLAPELLGPLRDFRTAAAVNYTLGRLLILLGSNRISSRDGTVIAYVCQLLLQSISQVRTEISLTHNPQDTEEELSRVLDATSSLLEHQNPSKGDN